MRFTVEQNDDVVIFTLKESRLDASTSSDVKAELLIVGQPDISTLIIDLSKIEFVDSSGLGALLLAHRQMKESGGSVALVGVSEQVRTLLRISQLDWLFEYYNTVEEAQAEISSAPNGTGDE